MAQAKRGAEMWIVKEHNQRCSVQRLGHKDGAVAFTLRGYKQASALVERLNRLDALEARLDALEAALQRLADAVEVESRYRHHMAYVDIMAARVALKAALVAAREVLR
jgi:hypothetical protein